MLNETYSEETEIPAGFSHLYTETNGQFTLRPPTDIKTVDDTTALSEALKKERADTKTYKAQLKAFEGIDPETYQASIDELEILRSQADPNLEVDELVAKKLEAQLNAKTAPLQRERDKLQSQLEETLERVNGYETAQTKTEIQNTIRNALTESQVRDTAVNELLSTGNFIFEKNDEGQIVTRDGLDGVDVGLTPDQWLEGKRETSPYYWPDSQGADAKGSSGTASTNNPFSKEAYNFTEQTRMMNENPVRAKQLAAQAGVDL